MNYTDLKTNIADICETTFTDAQVNMFIQQKVLLKFGHIGMMRIFKKNLLYLL